MPTPSFNDLIALPSQDDVLNQEVLPELTIRKVRVTDWIQGGVYRGMAYVAALMRANQRAALAAFFAAGFEDYAFGRLPAPGGIDVTGWCDLVGRNRYGVTRLAATYTRRSITLTNSSGSAYGPLQSGGVIVLFPTSGNRYILDQTVTIPANGVVQATFRSEYANDSTQGLIYNDPASSSIILVTASYPGVVATNPSTTYSAVSVAGTSSGTLTLGGAPTGFHSIALRVDAPGQVGSGAWSLSVDGGPWATQGAIGTINNAGGLGINITPVNGGANPSFTGNTFYYFQTPGSDVTQVGQDIESPQAYGARCQALWPMLGFVQDGAGNWLFASPTSAAYEALARSVSSQVKSARAFTGTVQQEVKLLLAAQGGPVPATTLAAVTAFFLSRNMLTDTLNVLTPVAVNILLGGLTITVKAALLASAQTALTKALRAYLTGLDPAAPLGTNPKIEHAYLVELIRATPGVTGVTDTTLTIGAQGGGAPAVADLQLPAAGNTWEMPNWQQDATAFSWVTV